MGHGDLHAVSHAGLDHAGLSHDLIAHCRGTATDVGHQDLDGEAETGDVVIVVGGRPRVGALGRQGGGRAGQYARAGVQGQAVGQGAGQGIGRGTVAADGDRQRQRSDGDVGDVDQAAHHGRTEGRFALLVDDGDTDGQRAGGHDARHHMSDGRRVVRLVPIHSGRDGDRLDRAPVRGGEGQGTGNGDRAGGIGHRGHGDVGVRHVGQHHGVGTLLAFIHGEGRGHEDDLRRREDRHGKGQGGGVGIGRVGVVIRDGPGQGDGRGLGGGHAGQGAIALGEGQAGGDGAGQGVRQRRGAAGGFGQGQRRDGGACRIGLVAHHGRAEIRRTVRVLDGEGHVPAGGDGVVAGDGMGDGDRVDVGVTIDEGRDGDGLSHVPGRGGEDQGTGDGDPVSVIGSRFHGDVAAGCGVQQHRIGSGGTLTQHAGLRVDGHARYHHHRYGKGQAFCIAGPSVCVRIGDCPGQRDGRGAHGGCPGHDAVGVGQAHGEGAGQGVGQGAGGAGGLGQRQRCDGGAPDVGLVGHRGHVETRRTVRVVDGDGYFPAVGEAAVAGDGVGDGGGVGVGVRVGEGRDGDGPGRVPVRGVEGQGAGDGD